MKRLFNRLRLRGAFDLDLSGLHLTEVEISMDLGMTPQQHGIPGFPPSHPGTDPLYPCMPSESRFR